MKLKYLISTLGAVAALALSGCGKDKKATYTQKFEYKSIPSTAKVSNDYFAVTPLNLNMVLGEQKTIDIAAIPASLSGASLTYTSKDASIASVDASGKVTALKKGVTSIEVSSDGGAVKETILVSVNEQIENSAGAAIFKEKGAAYRDPSFAKTTKLWAHEYVEQTLNVGGKTVNKAAYVEDIIFDMDEAYFEVYSDDIEIKTPDGSITVSSGKWIFFVNQESFDTYLIHETPTSKNYMEVHTQDYLGLDAYTILLDILNMFFTSGSSIVTDYLEDADGVGFYDKDSSLFIDCAEHEYSNAVEKCYTPNDTDIYATLDLTLSDQEITPAEEYSIDIPAGTVYDETQNLNLFVRGSHVSGYDVTDTMVFSWNEQDCVRTFEKQIQFRNDFEITIPTLSEYGLVDSIYDL